MSDDSTVRVQEFVSYIEDLKCQLPRIAASEDSHTQAFERLARWDRNLTTVLASFGLTHEIGKIRELASRENYDVEAGVKTRHFGYLKECTDRRDSDLEVLLEDVETNPRIWEARLDARRLARTTGGSPRAAVPSRDLVFLGHGHDSVWARVQLHVQNDLRLNVEAWESRPRAGHHGVDVLKRLLDTCGFAVIIATAEDETADGEVRARQNVIHEIGLFQGRLGFEKVAILRQKGLEDFSNLAGLQVIPFPADNVKAAFHDLDETLRREGMLSH